MLSMVAFRRLHQVIICALAHRLNGRFQRGIAGEDDGDGARRGAPRLGQHVQPVDVAQAQIRQHQIILLRAQLLDRHAAAAGAIDRVTLLLQDRLNRHHHTLLVIHHQDAPARGAGDGHAARAGARAPGRIAVIHVFAGSF
jgi:hypothetical protein